MHTRIMERKSEYLQVALYAVVLLGLFVDINAQPTHLRTCDCEYIDNGRCAYTIMIPVFGNSDGSNSCPTQGHGTTEMPDNSGSSNELNQRLDDLHARLEGLLQNLTMLGNDRTEQVLMIAQLQSIVMEHTNTLRSLQENYQMLLNMSDPITDTPQCCQSLNQSVHDLQDDLTMAKSTLSKLTLEFNITLSNITDQQLRISDLETEIVMHRMDIANLASSMNSFTRDYFLCQQKGLLVSGDMFYINDSAITVTSTNNSATFVRIHTEGAWCPEDANVNEDLPLEWVQFDLGQERAVFGVVTRGRSDYGQWVTSYRLEYSNDIQEESEWKVHQDVLGDEVVFEGNYDSNTTKTNMLWQPVAARYIRIVPLAGRIQNENMGNRCMRADLIGCVDP